MDHPAFVVAAATRADRVVAEFRGGVAEPYFRSAKVLLHRGRGRGRTDRGTVRCPAPHDAAPTEEPVAGWQIHFPGAVRASAGDILTWDVGPPQINKGRLHAPACDDLAGLAAALGAFDLLLAQRGRSKPNVRVLLTRAEEVGFIGAIAAARGRNLPNGARFITLENSKSFADSPVGGGPIVRVGDRTSTFDPELTYRLGRIAEELAEADDSFKWQRRLMPGGTCEASAFQAFGRTAACLCLPLENYHNMDERTGRIAAESISVADFRDLVRLLVAVGQTLDNGDAGLRPRLEKLFEQRKGVLG
jgi:endoglucanase